MKYSIATRCIHGAGTGNRFLGAVSVPIFQTATFAHPGVGESTGYNYTRESNPTREELEKIVSSLEGAQDTIACSSGMAAIGLCLELLDRGSHLICTRDLYGGSVRLFASVGESRGCTFSYVDTTNPQEVEKHIRRETKALYIETPSNPTMQVTDLAEMKKLADAYRLLLIVDNTFLSPYFQNSIALAVRMEKQQSNAIQIANWLKDHKRVEQVYYVGLESHPEYSVNRKQARGFGSMISFRTDTEETARRALQKVKLISCGFPSE